ncbi:MAG: putative sugar O-methyltransferase, partial [Deltaproteobacteria bacterium]|nr:putative sugar O-methyltransferase [Deltaproteobacteria bacterium]
YMQIIKLSIFRKYFLDPYIENVEKILEQSKKYKDYYYTNIFGRWFSQFSEKYSLPKTLIGNPQNTISINNYRVANTYFASFIRIHNFSKCVDFSNVKNVFEIGGGFGSMCHTLLTLFPNIKKYLYLDIPPILYVATQYLKFIFEEKVIDYRDTKDLDKIRFSSNDEREIIAICPWQIEKVDVHIDLFWNSASFQEMAPEMVINYIQHVNRMLKNHSSKLCIYIYKGGKPEKTILPEELIRLIENNIPITFEELIPEIEVAKSHYYLGRSS